MQHSCCSPCCCWCYCCLSPFVLTGIPARLCWLILVGPRWCSPVLVHTRRHLFMLVSIIFLSPFVPTCLSVLGCAGWVSPRSCSLPLPHAVSCSCCHPDPTPAPVPPVVLPFVCSPFVCSPRLHVPPFVWTALFMHQRALCRRSLPPLPSQPLSLLWRSRRSFGQPVRAPALIHTVPPFVCLCRRPFVLVLVGASFMLVWLSFMLVCLFVLVRICLGSFVCKMHSQYTHLIRELTFVKFIINLDMNIWLVFDMQNYNLLCLKWDVSGSEREKGLMVRSVWPIKPYLVPSRCDTISLKYFVPHIFVFTINYFIYF